MSWDDVTTAFKPHDLCYSLTTKYSAERLWKNLQLVQTLPELVSVCCMSADILNTAAGVKALKSIISSKKMYQGEREEPLLNHCSRPEWQHSSQSYMELIYSTENVSGVQLSLCRRRTKNHPAVSCTIASCVADRVLHWELVVSR